MTFYQGSLSEGVELIVVVFPSMTDIEKSQPITDKVINVFEERRVPVLDVAPLIDEAPVEQRIVSALDAHPSVWVNQQVADALYEMVINLE